MTTKSYLTLPKVLLYILFAIFCSCATATKQTPEVSQPAPTKQAATINVGKPTWFVRDTWTYKRIETGKVYTQTVDKIENDFYVIRENGINVRRSFFYYTTDLAHSHSTDAQGRVFYKNDPPMRYYSWPLQPGKKWTERIYWVDLKTSNTIGHHSRVVGMESVKVPAGEFQAMKIVRTAGAWTYTYWYSPEVKKHVKWITVNPEGTFSHELVEYHVQP